MCEMNGALTYSAAADTALVARESAPPNPRPPRLLDRVRDAVRARHYSRRTEKAYVAWIRRCQQALGCGGYDSRHNSSEQETKWLTAGLHSL
jgi:Phage integrase, N-terminal SAM-like domain